MGNTPLLHAARDGTPWGIALLLAHGADPSATNAAGQSARQIAASRTDILEALSAHSGEPLALPPNQALKRIGHPPRVWMARTTACARQLRSSFSHIVARETDAPR